MHLYLILAQKMANGSLEFLIATSEKPIYLTPALSGLVLLSQKFLCFMLTDLWSLLVFPRISKEAMA